MDYKFVSKGLVCRESPGMRGKGADMSVMGFNFSVPQAWSKLWLLMWLVCSSGLVALAFVVPFWPNWVLFSLVLFGVPEAVGIARERDGLPPLTHAIRHFLPNWVAFPLIYFLLGTIGTRSLGFPRPWRVGLLFGLLGWLTDHFSVSYSRDDPFPEKGAGATPEDLSANVDPRPRAF